jgi:PhnB protein
MANGDLSEQLDRLVDAILAPGAVRPEGDAEVVPLAAIAEGLRGLPRPDFKGKLKTELMRRATMPVAQETKKQSSRTRQLRTVTPYLIATRGEEMFDFVKNVFGAQELSRDIGSAGGYHCEMRVGDSMLMLGGGAKYKGPSSPGTIHIKVDNVDEVYRKAIDAGATPLHEPMDMEYGERGAAFKDPFGNTWYPATPMGTTHWLPEMGTAVPYLHPRGADKMIEFLKQAFGAEEMERYAPQGTILHAKIRVGDSVLEMGEAHGPYQALESTFFMSVENADQAYQRAVAAGAEPVSPPADLPFGARVGTVRDPFGNIWYLAAEIAK